MSLKWFNTTCFCMLSLIDNNFFSMKVSFKKRYSNKEIIYYRYFYQKTNIIPDHLIVLNNFIFFFVKNSDYFKAKYYLNSFRKELGAKIMIIRAEKILINLLFGFFPDPYIHDIIFAINKNTGAINVTMHFLSFEERGIAIGRNGEYIKAINEIFEKFIIYEKSIDSMKIKCELIEL
jgi:hypothetical protein